MELGTASLARLLERLLAVLAGLLVADVEPCLTTSLLKDELVEEGVALAEPVVPFADDGIGSFRFLVQSFRKWLGTWILALGSWNFLHDRHDVGGFATDVLAGVDASHGGIEVGTAVTAGYFDRDAKVFAEGFEDVKAELLEVADFLNGGYVVDATGGGDGALGELGELEMFGKLDVHDVVMI